MDIYPTLGIRGVNRERFESADTFKDYLTGVEKNRQLWHDVYERARVSDEIVLQARELPADTYLLALSEDWCGDAVNTLPVIARFADQLGWDFRVLGRDSNLDLMDAHLTNGRSRSIPVVMAYDKGFQEIGWWGPRPEEIQTWLVTEGLAIPSRERYRVIRRWYAKDRGQTTLQELLEVLLSAI